MNWVVLESTNLMIIVIVHFDLGDITFDRGLIRAHHHPLMLIHITNSRMVLATEVIVLKMFLPLPPIIQTVIVVLVGSIVVQVSLPTTYLAFPSLFYA